MGFLKGEGAKMMGATDFKAHMASYLAEMNETGVPIVLLKHNRPWAVISPPASVGREKGGRNLYGQEDARRS